MTLQNLLPTLSKNESLNITLIGSDDEKLITFNAAGYENVESDLFSREVTKITVISNKDIQIKIAASA